MKVYVTITLCILSFLASAQEPQIIGGYLLDGEDSFEELDAAVVTDAKRRDKNLDGKGMRFPGGAMMMIPESICFTVDENRMEGCKSSIRIYRITEDGDLANIVTMPISQDIPKAEKKTTFSIVPQENLELEPGEYYISFALTEISETIADKWANAKTWNEKERYVNQLEDSMFFPVYVKSSYSRENSDSPLTKWKYNIGMTVIGKILD